MEEKTIKLLAFIMILCSIGLYTFFWYLNHNKPKQEQIFKNPELYKVKAIVNYHLDNTADSLQVYVKKQDKLKIAELEGARLALLEIHAVIEKEITYLEFNN